MHNAMFLLGSNRDGLVSEKLLADPINSQHQREAAATLSDYSSEDILAWLKLVRSARNIEPILEPRPRGTYLTPSQIQALVTLKDCPNDRLEAYLVLARLDCQYENLAVYNRNADSLLKGNDLTSAALTPGSSIDPGLSNNLLSFLRPSDPPFFETGVQKECSQQDPSLPDFNPYGRRQSATNDLDLFGHHDPGSVNLDLSEHPENHYWCTACEVPKSYKDSGNWKKHEKEHETRFVCKLDSATHESMADQNPGTKAFSSKRRDIMVNHLNKSHGLAVQEGRVLADQWRFTVKKQAWSCGFCGSLLLDFKDRLRHIDTEHFRKYESMQQWDFNKVIHGLLLQPRMENAWTKRTASLFPWVQPEDLIWTEAFAKNMRQKLEIGPLDESDANRLADEICSAGKPKESLNESATALDTVFPTSIAGVTSLLSPNQYQAVTTQTSESARQHSQKSSNMHATANLFGDSLFDKSPGHAYNDDIRAVPSMAPLEEHRPATYNPRSFYSAQDWVAESEAGIGNSGFDDTLNEVHQGFSWSNSDWNGQ